MTSIIVSYDGTANENDAIAYGSLLAGAGAEVHLGYVRHSQELVSDQEANELLARGTALFDGQLAGAAGNRRAPAGVAATTWRTGGRGESARIEMSSRTTGFRASSGIKATPTPAATRPWTVW